MGEVLHPENSNYSSSQSDLNTYISFETIDNHDIAVTLDNMSPALSAHILVKVLYFQHPI